MHGEGSYTYKKNGDIYSGSWVANKKQGEGRYEYGQDMSVLSGTWDKGQLVSGTWELKKAGTYKGKFEMSRPIGAGKFTFVSGLSQEGTFDKIKVEDEEEPAEDEEPKPPNVEWKGKSIVSF